MNRQNHEPKGPTTDRERGSMNRASAGRSFEVAASALEAAQVRIGY